MRTTTTLMTTAPTTISTTTTTTTTQKGTTIITIVTGVYNFNPLLLHSCFFLRLFHTDVLCEFCIYFCMYVCIYRTVCTLASFSSFYNYYASKYAYYYYEMASNNECASVESAAYHAQQHANGGYVESDMCFCSTLCGIYRDDFLYDCYVKIENATCKTKMDTKWLVGFYSFAGLIAAWLLALLLYFVWMDGKRRGGGTQSMPMSTQIEMEPDDENTRGGMDMRGDFELVSSVSSHGAGAVERNSRSDGGRVVDFRSSDNKSATMMQDISLHDEEDNDIHHLPLASDDEDQNAVTSAIHQNSEQV